MRVVPEPDGDPLRTVPRVRLVVVDRLVPVVVRPVSPRVDGRTVRVVLDRVAGAVDRVVVLVEALSSTRDVPAALVLVRPYDRAVTSDMPDVDVLPMFRDRSAASRS